MPSTVRSLSVSLIAMAVAAGLQAPVMAQPGTLATNAADDQARTIADLQRQIDQLKAIVEQLQVAQVAPTVPAAPAIAAAQPSLVLPAQAASEPAVLAKADAAPMGASAAPAMKTCFAFKGGRVTR